MICKHQSPLPFHAGPVLPEGKFCFLQPFEELPGEFLPVA